MAEEKGEEMEGKRTFDWLPLMQVSVRAIGSERTPLKLFPGLAASRERKRNPEGFIG